jgi:ATP-binding cassette subfamily F protein 3
MAMATIDAPHILIFDEPTNHLDIESREALVHALNAYEGTVILVSHDPHLVETVADQLWIVQDGLVVPFDGDMADYQRQLLARPAIDEAAGQRKKSKSMRSGAKSEYSELKHRQDLSQLRAKVKSVEKALGVLAIEKKQTEVDMAKPGFYDRGNSQKIAELSIKLAKIEAAIVEAEKDWLVAEEALDTAQQALLQ